jgi:hypothetical protein
MKAREKDRLFQELTRLVGFINTLLLLLIIQMTVGIALGLTTTVFRLTQVLFSQPVI